MNFKEINKLFQSRVDALTYEKKYKLALSICKKLFPDYQDFYLDNHWGVSDILLDSIKFCQQYNTQEIDISPLIEMLPKVDKITPDTEDFGMLLMH